jgi:transposase
MILQIIKADENYSGISKVECEQVIDKRCCLDVHRDTDVAIVMGKGIKIETRTFGITTSSLNELGKWLQRLKVTD